MSFRLVVQVVEGGVCGGLGGGGSDAVKGLGMTNSIFQSAILENKMDQYYMAHLDPFLSTL